MSLKENLRNPIIQQYAIEIVFPLLGYFVFDWDILVIGVYYLIDHLAAQLLFFRRSIKVKQSSDFAYSLYPVIIAAVLFVLVFIVEIVFFVYLIHFTQVMSFSEIWEAFYSFLKSELWFLFPLVLLMYYMKDQLTFYAPRRYLKFDYKAMLKWDAANTIIIATLFLISGSLWYAVKLPNALVIIIFVIIKLAYDFTLKKYFLKRSHKV